MHLQPKSVRERRGTATVELAVIAPFLVLLVVVGVDFARVYYHNLTLINAAHTGALYASAHPDNTVKTQQIKDMVLGDTKNIKPDPAVDVATSSDGAGSDYVTVTVSWDFYTIVDYPGVARPLTLTRSVKMRVGPAQPLESAASN